MIARRMDSNLLRGQFTNYTVRCGCACECTEWAEIAESSLRRAMELAVRAGWEIRSDEGGWICSRCCNPGKVISEDLAWGRLS